MINKNGYSDAEINSELHIKSGIRHISFRFDLLNKDEIKIGELSGISGRISYGENRAIMRSAVFEVLENEANGIDFFSDMLQPWFILHMKNGGTVEWPLGVFLLESPSRRVNGRAKTCSLGAYDKTIIIEQDRFTERFYISKGSSYTSTIERILNTSGIYYSKIAQNSLTFQEDVEYSTGTKKKTVINELLRSMNYTPIYADENGVLNAFSYTMPSDRAVEHSYSSYTDSILFPRFEESYELAGMPNIFTRVASNMDRIEMVSTYKNNDPSSPLSILRRGRNIVDYARIDIIATQELLDNYVKRLAVERTATYNKLSFNTVLMPGHGCFKAMFLDIPEVLETPSKFMETAWDMDLKYDGVMRHEARKVVSF